MPTSMPRARAGVLACVLALPLTVQADDAGVRSAALLDHRFWIEPNVTYLTASGKELKLDVYRPSLSLIHI